MELSERLASLRQSADTSVRSNETAHTSLRSFLYIYNRAKDECYADYMLGARELYKYLAPIESRPPEHYTRSLPDMLMSYELTGLAQILTGWTGYKTATDLAKVRLMEQDIVRTLLEEDI